MTRSPSDDGGKVVRPFAFFRAGVRSDARISQRPILTFDGVYKYFREDQPTLKDVHLEIERGEFAFITGPSGAGKSTLLQLIYRKHTVDQGQILFCGRDVARLTDSSIPFLRRNLGIVFQDFKVVPHWTVYENIAIAL
jgi:cell division transport system ATP-binding protein